MISLFFEDPRKKSKSKICIFSGLSTVNCLPDVGCWISDLFIIEHHMAVNGRQGLHHDLILYLQITFTPFLKGSYCFISHLIHERDLPASGWQVDLLVDEIIIKS